MLKTKRKKMEAIQGICYITPSTLLILVFSVIPIIGCIIMSFTKYNLLSDAEWIGLSNYSSMLKDKTVLRAFKNTMIYVFVTVPIQTIVSLVLAALIAGRYRGRFGNIVKASLFIPVIASPATVTAVWTMLLTTNGTVNSILEYLGLATVNWLGSKTLTIYVVCFVCMWTSVGYFLVILYAGIMDIPRHIYESAEMDGASPLQQFWYITIPNLKSVLYLVILLGIIYAFQEFDIVQMLTGGGPGNATISLVVTIYKAAFKESRMGYACAISILLLVCVLIVSIIQKAVMRGDGGED